MRELELRRHAARAKDADALSPEGRVQAEDVGRTLEGPYDVVFVSPARRAAETAAWFLRGSGGPLPDHAVVPGLTSEAEDRWRAAAKAAGSSRIDAIVGRDAALVDEEATRLGRAVEELFDRVPEGGRGLAVGHTPLVEGGRVRPDGQHHRAPGRMRGRPPREGGGGLPHARAEVAAKAEHVSRASRFRGPAQLAERSSQIVQLVVRV
jgi:Histidine phosphatase superfamily (branch 1)